MNEYESLKSPALNLLNENGWGEYSGLIQQLKNWSLYPELITALVRLKRPVLYKSPVHGEGHIERTMLHGAIAAMDQKLGLRDTQLLLLACAYHDTGRQSDWLDDMHGRRSARKLAGITGLQGDELSMVMAAVEAHSRKDSEMNAILSSYAPAEPKRCHLLALMLKDSDGLDRVRISDLNPAYMRLPAAAERAGFAEYLFERYQEECLRTGIPVPDKKQYYNRELVVRVRDRVHAGLTAGELPAAIVSDCLCSLLQLRAALPQDAHPCGENFADRRCSVLDGTLTVLKAWQQAKGTEGNTVLDEFLTRFRAQYHADTCRALRPCVFEEGDSPYICAPFMLDVILFSYQYLSDRN